MQRFVKICAPLFDKKHGELCAVLLQFASGFVREALKYSIAEIFFLTCRNSALFLA